MSREIEFRVYDKEKNMWTNFKIFDNIIYFMDKNTGVWFNKNHKEYERFELMQYTDCTDSKGKMIFEGDILLSSNENGTFLQLIGFGESEKEYDSVLKGFKIINGCTLENDDYEINQCKPLTRELIKKNDIPIIEEENIIMDGQWVIGNKYQNPELLELLEE